MSKTAYRPFNPEAIGTTVSCYTLARMLDEVGSNNLNRKITAHINRYFCEVKKISLGIYCPEIRAYVGEMILKHIKHFPPDLECPDQILNVIKNVKYAYVKDMLISEAPLNYTRTLKIPWDTIPLECRGFLNV